MFESFNDYVKFKISNLFQNEYFSKFFTRQLASVEQADYFFSLTTVLEEIKKLENGENSSTKPATKFNNFSELNIMHKHFFQPSLRSAQINILHQYKKNVTEEDPHDNFQNLLEEEADKAYLHNPNSSTEQASLDAKIFSNNIVGTIFPEICGIDPNSTSTGQGKLIREPFLKKNKS